MSINVLIEGESTKQILRLSRDGSDIDLKVGDILLGWFSSDGTFILAYPSDEEVTELKELGFAFDKDGQLQVSK